MKLFDEVKHEIRSLRARRALARLKRERERCAGCHESVAHAEREFAKAQGDLGPSESYLVRDLLRGGKK